MTWHELGPFTVFDVETTGTSPIYDRIVELAAIRIDKDGSKKHFHSLLNPGRKIPSRVICIHHITDMMVCNSPHFAEIGMDFLNFSEGSTLVAHNARFDLSFLQESLARCNLPIWEGKTIDSLRLIRTTHPGLHSYSLQELRKTLKLDDNDGSQAHRASSDVAWTVQVLQIALTKALNQQPQK